MTQVNELENEKGEFSVEKIKMAVETAVQNLSPKSTDTQPLSTTVLLVLDEAATVGKHIQKLPNPQAIYKLLVPWCKWPRLVVVGTGIDEFTSALGSGTDVLKYRMGRWKTESLRKALPRWLRGLGYKNYDSLYQIILREPMYRKLATNARAAYFLAEAVNMYRVFDDNVQQYMGSVVMHVAKQYIDTNGLKQLTTNQ